MYNVFEGYKNFINYLKKENTMTVGNQILTDAETIAPNAPVVEAAAAVVATVADPSPATIIADLETAHTLITQFKAAMNGLHPSIANLFKALF